MDRFPVLDVKSSATLVYAVQKLIVTRTHRLWIIDENYMLCGVISLTDILRFLNK